MVAEYSAPALPTQGECDEDNLGLRANLARDSIAAKQHRFAPDLLSGPIAYQFEAAEREPSGLLGAPFSPGGLDLMENEE